MKRRSQEAALTAAGGLLTTALLLLVPRPARAEGQGIYGPIELQKREAQLMLAANQYEEMFLRRGYRYAAPDLEALIARIGARLAPAPTDVYIRYRFHILRDPEPNAFALPDGQIYMNTGILALLDNESEVAAILAHEINHTAGHHGILTYRSVRRKAVTDMVLGPLTLGWSDIFLELSVYGYSRDLESEADVKGAQRMVEASYDPGQMIRIFEILQQDPREAQPKRATAWSAHPQLQARVETVRALLPGLLAGVDPASLRAGAGDFRRIVRKTALDTVEDLIGSDFPRSALELARRLVAEDGADAARHLALGDSLRALGPRDDPAAGRAATDEEKRANRKERARMTRQERERERRATPEGTANLRRHLEEAGRSYRRSLELDAGLAEAHRGLGYALADLGDSAGAGREFVAYLRARPEAPDHALVLDHLKKVTETLKKGETGHDANAAQ